MIVQLGASNSFVNAVALQGDGKIVVAGAADSASTNNQWLVARLKTNGSFDPSFGAGGRLTVSPGINANAVALQRDGKIVLTGDAYAAGGTFGELVARLNANGSLDPSFGTGGKLTTQLGAGATPDSSLRRWRCRAMGRSCSSATPPTRAATARCWSRA